MGLILYPFLEDSRGFNQPKVINFQHDLHLGLGGLVEIGFPQSTQV